MVKKVANNFVISDELNEIIQKLAKKDKPLAEALNKKMKQIINFEWTSLDHFKNLQYSLSDFKRAHISKSFVLLFRVDKQHNQIRFETLKHHDEAYK